MKRVVSIKALESGRITHTSQNGSREFLSLLACIYINNTALPSTLIYKGNSRSLQDIWFEDWKPNKLAHFAITSNGWSCDMLRLDWLEQVFHWYTKKKADNRRYLLIINGHFSHVNMRFMEKCDELYILLLILSPHSTHHLQPLDMSLFSPLLHYYSAAVNALMFDSINFTNLFKRAF